MLLSARPYPPAVVPPIRLHHCQLWVWRIFPPSRWQIFRPLAVLSAGWVVGLRIGVAWWVRRCCYLMQRAGQVSWPHYCARPHLGFSLPRGLPRKGSLCKHHWWKRRTGRWIGWWWLERGFGPTVLASPVGIHSHGGCHLTHFLHIIDFCLHNII